MRSVTEFTGYAMAVLGEGKRPVGTAGPNERKVCRGDIERLLIEELSRLPPLAG